MTDKLFDDFFKQKLENHDSGAPMHVWEKVRRELHEEDDDKGIIWWKNPIWLITFFLLAGGITTTGIIGNKNGWFGNRAEAGTIVQNNNVNQLNTHTENTTITAPASTNTNNPVTPENNDITTASDHQSNGKPSIANKTKGDIIPANAVASTEVQEKKNKQENSASPYQKINRRTRTKSNLINPKPTDLTGEVLTATDKLNNINNNYYLPLASGGAYTRSSANKFELQKLNGQSVFNITSSCPTIGPPRRNDLYIEVYASPDNVSRSLSGTNFTPVDYINKRKDAEKSKVGFSAGIRIAKNLGERTILKTGFNYSQINETLKYINEKDIRIVTVITQRTIISNGQTITISDTTQVTQIGTTYTTFHNRYRTLDIPVIFAYEFGNSHNFSVGINAGAIININSSYRGKILDTSLVPVSINTVNTLGVNAWRKNIGLGLYASISIYKRINDKMQLFFEPYTRINLKPVTVNTTLVKQKYNTTGLQLGVRYNLFYKRQRYVE